MEQRRPMLHAGVAAAFADRLVNRVARGGLAEQLAPGGAEARYAGRVQRRFADRAQREARHILDRALAGGIEAADALHRVAEEIQAQRLGLAAREHVENAAAHGEFAGLHHRVGAVVAVGGQELGQAFGAQRAAGGHAQRMAGKRVARRHALQHGVHRGKDNARAGGRLQQAGQRGDAVGHRGGVGAGAVVGQAIPGREAQHLQVRREIGQQIG